MEHIISKLLQDFERGRRLELDAIAYSCLELARRRGLDLPVGRTLADLAAFIAKAATPSGEHSAHIGQQRSQTYELDGP